MIDQGAFNLPQGSGTAELVPVKYPADGGYTPGDTWSLYVAKDNRVVYFDYHRGGTKFPSRVLATWAGYKKAGPLLFATEHRGPKVSKLDGVGAVHRHQATSGHSHARDPTRRPTNRFCLQLRSQPAADPRRMV